MTKERYQKMTSAFRGLLAKIPGGEKLLALPTILCAGIYLFFLLRLLAERDIRIIRVVLVPAVCFLAVTVLRPIIDRQRPYDAFGIPPVGKWQPGKGKSMPSRHMTSAAAIAFAVAYGNTSGAVWIGMLSLAFLIGFIRILSGRHYPSDIIAGTALAALLSWIGYTI